MKVMRIILSIITCLLGLSMMSIAYYFFFNEEEEIICLASLYVSLFVSIMICAFGISLFLWKKGEQNESNND